MGPQVKVHIGGLLHCGELFREGDSFKIVRGGPIAFQGPGIGNDPQAVLPVHVDLSQTAVGPSGNVLKLFVVEDKIFAAVAVEPILGGKPEVARAVLGNTDDAVLGQPALDRQVLKGELGIVLCKWDLTK